MDVKTRVICRICRCDLSFCLRPRITLLEYLLSDVSGRKLERVFFYNFNFSHTIWDNLFEILSRWNIPKCWKILFLSLARNSNVFNDLCWITDTISFAITHPQKPIDKNIVYNAKKSKSQFCKKTKRLVKLII